MVICRLANDHFLILRVYYNNCLKQWYLTCYTETRKSKEEVITMVTLEEAREIAADWLTDISGCTEFILPMRSIIREPRTLSAVPMHPSL